MKCLMRWTLALLVAAACAATAGAQSYEINWTTVDEGGGTASSGAFQLDATIGQPDAGVLQGGSFVLQGGFWGAFAERGCDVDGDGDCDAVDLVWVVECHPDPSGCGCPGNPDRNRDTTVDGGDTEVILGGEFG